MSDIDKNAPGQGGEGSGDNNPAPTSAPSPAATVVTPPADSKEEMVTMKKTEYEAMIGRQSSLDKKEARLAKREERLKKGQTLPISQHGQSEQPPKPASQEVGSDGLTPEDHKAERALMRLAAKPEYREVLDANPMLRDMLLKNPLAVVATYAPDANDAEDAEEMITEHLEGLKTTVKKPVVPEAKKEEERQVPPASTTPSLIGTPFATEALSDPKYQETIKGGSTRDIAGGLRMRLSRAVKK